ncbi:MAG: protein kinase [Myxococcales bacterium]|nr:protein kinase [Myxococcales bacterium]
MDLGLIGATIANRYELIQRIGHGGMGDVYRAHDRELDEAIALKVVRDEVARVPGVLERFRAEVKLARRVTHRNVARTYELGVTDELAYFTMELVEGESLEERLGAGPLTPAGAIAGAAELCDALAAAHAAGVIHRDLKPANVMLAPDGRVVLTDFGVAALATAAEDGSSGTPLYMAPEQARGEPPTPLVDVYALGLVLYEMVIGAPAFAGDLGTTLDAKQDPDHRPPALSAIEPGLAAIIARAVAFDPRARWPGVDALRAALVPARAAASAPMPASAPDDLGLPTVLVAPPAAPAAVAHRVSGFHLELLRRLSRRGHMRLARRTHGDVGGRGARVVVTGGDHAIVTIALTGRREAVTLSIPLDVDALVEGAELTSRLIAAAVGAGPERGDDEPPITATARELLWRAQAGLRREGDARALVRADFAAALAAAPGDARIMAGLAMCEVRAAFFAATPQPGALGVAAARATAAAAAAPHLAETQIASGHLRLHQGDATAAAVHFRAAIARAPYLPEAHEWLGRMLLEAGYLVDGMARLADVLEMEPGLEAPRWDLARAYALEQRWGEHDRVMDELRAVTGDPVGRVGVRLRFAGWRGRPDEVAAIRREMGGATLPPMFERALADAIGDAVAGGPWAPVRAQVLASLSANGGDSARRRALIAQLVAEFAGGVGELATAVAMVELAIDHGLFDRHWLERCPPLAGLRAHPAYPALHARVAARADAVLDALYGDHGHRATADTLLVSAASR